ncbi:hypothetical protein FRC01_012730 [Tulasnella sp. 417]|nr:hypothetical protein FRC01_012730 [Tulasnella sp. 417]
MPQISEGYRNCPLQFEQRIISQLLDQGTPVEHWEFYYMWNDLFREWFDSLYGWIVMQEQYADVSPSFKVAVAVDKSGASVQDGDYDRVARGCREKLSGLD